MCAVVTFSCMLTDPAGAPMTRAILLPTSIGISHQRSSQPRTPRVGEVPEGWEGCDQYAPFYDWENARTLGRRDVSFWRRVARTADGRVLELGCGTGRVSVPLARAGVDLVGVDRSAPMLARAQR